MKRVVMIHPDVDGPRSFTETNAMWLKGRDARWQDVRQNSPLDKLKADAGNEGTIKKAVGGADKQGGNKRVKKAGGTDKVSQ